MASNDKRPKGRRSADRDWYRWLYHQIRVQIRLIGSILVGLAVWVLFPLEDQIDRILAAWNAAGWLYIALLLVMMMRAEVDGIRRQAEIEEESRSAALIITTLGAIFMFLAIVAQLSALSEESGLERRTTLALSFSTILVSWLLVQVVFAVYYAHEFHSESRQAKRGAGGGLKFSGQSVPDYLDFLYFSFVVGTTNQTSDTEVTSRAMRRAVMIHGLLSFFFNTMVIALTVNLTAQLVQGG
jgi:uncharacterized membrane protein